MYTGRLIFSQLMDHLPMPTFRRCVERYQGDRWVKSFRCVEHYRCMAFAQLTYRESLRDIEACLRAQGAKLYHMGIRGAVSRSTLADANEQRDWRIYADFAQRPHPHGPPPLCGRRLGPGTRRDRLCPRLLNHRSVSHAVPLGRLPQDQGGGQAAHTSRPARLHPGLHPHLHRQAPTTSTSWTC